MREDGGMPPTFSNLLARVDSVRELLHAQNDWDWQCMDEVLAVLQDLLLLLQTGESEGESL